MKVFAKSVITGSIFLGIAANAFASEPGTIKYLERGEQASLRFVIQEGNELKCLTDVSDQAYSTRDVSWNRCAADVSKPDFQKQQWFMKDVNTDDGMLLNNLMVFRPANGQFRILSVGEKFESGNKAVLNLVHVDTIEIAEGPSTRFLAFDFQGLVDNKLTAVLSLLQIQTNAELRPEYFCIGKPEGNFSEKGAVAVKFSPDASEEFATAYPNCADIISLSYFK